MTGTVTNPASTSASPATATLFERAPAKVNLSLRVLGRRDDGYHDLWNISALDSQSNAKIVIYNRYGKILTMINAISPGWDGTYKGKPLPSDDYWFVLTYLDNKGLPRQVKSHFALKR